MFHADFLVVVDPVKVVKIQLITTFVVKDAAGVSCCWPCKGSKNSANHNTLQRIQTRAALLLTL